MGKIWIGGLVMMSAVIGLVFQTGAARAESAQIYLENMPRHSQEICDRKVDVNKFKQDMDEFQRKMDKDIERRQKLIDAAMKGQKEQADRAALDKAGLSGVEVPQGKKKFSEAEKQELRNKVMMEKTGMDMADIERLKKMSKEGKKNWAQAQMAETQAAQEAEPEKAKKDAKSASMNYGAAVRQNELNMKIAAIGRRLAEPTAAVDRDPIVRRSQLDAGFSVSALVTEGDLSSPAGQEKIQRMIEDAQNGKGGDEPKKQKSCEEGVQTEQKFCTEWTTRYSKALDREKEMLPGAFQEYAEIEKEQKKTWKELYGIDAPPEVEGMAALKAVRAYSADVARYYDKWPKRTCIKFD